VLWWRREQIYDGLTIKRWLSFSHMEIIRALVEAGADIRRPNHFGGTCLINSVQVWRMHT
jgi:hypothetical protein